MSKHESKWALVAGATGYLGQYVVRALAREGWKIRALARDESRLGEVLNLCDDVFVGEATDPQSLLGLCEGIDAVFSSIGIRHFHRTPTYEDVDYRANLNIVESAQEANVRRFVFVSVLRGEEIRASSPLIDARERVVDALRNSSMESVILRPTGFFNDMSDYFKMAQKGKVWLIGSGETRINPVHGEDLADVAAAAMGDSAPDADIPVGGPTSYSQREIANLCFDVLDKKRNFGKIRPGLLRFAAKVVGPFNKNASALALMFASLGESDAVAPSYGHHQLSEHFSQMAENRRTSVPKGSN